MDRATWFTLTLRVLSDCALQAAVVEVEGLAAARAGSTPAVFINLTPPGTLPQTKKVYVRKLILLDSRNPILICLQVCIFTG